MKKILWIVLVLSLIAGPALAQDAGKGNPTVVIKTNKGEIEAVLYRDKSPITVENFLKYVDDGFYSGTIFHRVIAKFMIQGGGFNRYYAQKPTRPPIKNEAANGLKNERGTLAMARTSVVDSATAQFFINVVDNAPLNHGARDYGYAVFRGGCHLERADGSAGTLFLGLSPQPRDHRVDPGEITATGPG